MAGTVWSALDILDKRGVENYPGRIGDAADIGGGIVELDPTGQQRPARPPQGPFDSFEASTKWRILIKVRQPKRNPRTGEEEERIFRVSARVKSRWIADQTGRVWQRFVLFR